MPLKIHFIELFLSLSHFSFLCQWLNDSKLELWVAAAAAMSFQSCLTLCNPIDGRPPGSPIPGILQAGTLDWVAISFSHAWKWKAKVKSLSHIRPLVTPWTATHQAPPSMGFSRQEYWKWGAIAFSEVWAKRLQMKEQEWGGQVFWPGVVWLESWNES